MVGLQIIFQELGGIAFPGRVTDEHDFIRRGDIFRDLVIKRIFFRHALAAVVSFLSMNQVMMEMERIVRADAVFVRRTTSAEILINMGRVVVDDDNHAAGLGRFCCGLSGSGCGRSGSGCFQEFTQPRNFLHIKIMSVRALKKGALSADAEDKFVVSMRLDLAQMLDQCDGLAPTQVVG